MLTLLLVFGQVLGLSACNFGMGKARVEYGDDGRTLVKYHGGGDSTVFKIPKKVTKIGRGAFADCGELTEIIIPDTVESIDAQAFAGCIGLMRITIPDSVTEIGDGAFYNCSELVSISLGSRVTSIGQAAFNGCVKLVEVLNHSSLELSAGGTDYGEIGYYAKSIHKGESLISELGGYLCYNSGDDRILLGYNGDDTELTLPDSIGGGGYEIHKYAFFDRDGLTSVTVPDSVTVIGERAFGECSSLARVDLGNGMKEIGAAAFIRCGSLESITLPESVDSIGARAFENCSSLVSAKLSAGLRSIGDYCFSGCSSLGEITVPEGVTYLGGGAFEGCTSLAKATISRGITAINEYTFYGCGALTSFSVPDGVTRICESAFTHCSSLLELSFPETLEWIELHAFESCYSLLSITVPESMEWIDELAFGFLSCPKLVEVINYSDLPIAVGSNYYIYNIGRYTYEIHSGESKLDRVGDFIFYSSDGVNYLMGYAGAEKNITLPENYGGEEYEIYDYAFAHNRFIESIVIPSGVTAIGKEVFLGCEESLNITVNDANDFYKSVDGALYSKNGNELIHSPAVSDGEVSRSDEGVEQDGYIFCTKNGKNYLTAYVGSDTVLTLPKSFEGTNYEIADHAFSEMRGITEVIIPKGVTAIGKAAFKECSALREVVIPDSVTFIGDNAFENCTSLDEITVPAGVTELSWYIFSGCSELSRVRLHDNITLIGRNAFYNCSSLRGIVLPRKLTEIRESVFEGCGELTGILIPKLVYRMYSDVFDGCVSMTSFAVDEKNEYFSSVDGVLYFDSKLKQYPIAKRDESFTVPEDVDVIGEYAFSDCLYLKNVIIPDGVTTIESDAFHLCHGLESVTIGGGVKVIGDDAFMNCDNLVSVVIPDNVQSIGGRAFAFCDSLTSVEIGSGLTEMGTYPFNHSKALTSIKVSTSNPRYKSIDGNLYDKQGTTLIQYALGKTAESFTVPASVTTVGSKAFSLCGSLNTVILGENVTSINNLAFSYCYNIRRVVVTNTEGWKHDDSDGWAYGKDVPAEIMGDPYELAKAILVDYNGDYLYIFEGWGE